MYKAILLDLKGNIDNIDIRMVSDFDIPLSLGAKYPGNYSELYHIIE